MFLSLSLTLTQVACQVVAVTLHYFFTSAFMWMCVEGFHLYMMVVSVFHADSVKMKYYYLFGWGL